MTVHQPTKPSRNFLLILIVASAIFNFSFLEYNNYKIRQYNPANAEKNSASLVAGQTIYSIDNEYYLSPVDNFLAGKGWKRGAAVGDGDYFRRVPGYSLLYLGFVEAFGTSNAFLFLKIFQLLLFLSTIPAIYYFCRLLTGDNVAKLVTIVYAFIPFVSSWAYYTLTESLSPFLTIFYVYFALRGIHSEAQKDKVKNYIWSSFFFIAAVLTRPYIALAGGILLAFSGRDFLVTRSTRNIRRFSLVWLIPFILLCTWTVRNYLLTKELVIFEKAYRPQSLDRMKPEFRGIFTFTKSWGEDGANFTRYHEPFFWPAIAGDTSSAPIHNILSSWPSKIVSTFGYDRLYRTLKEHQAVLASYRPYYDRKISMPDHWTDQQLQVESAYKKLENEYRQSHFMDYWVMARLTYLKRMVVHSNTSNLFLFQKESEMPVWVYLYKVLLFGLHVLFYLALFLNIFFMKGWINRLVFVYTPLLFVFFISFIHREVEARYMLPMLPFIIAGSAATVEKVISAVNQFFGRQKLRIVTDAN